MKIEKGPNVLTFLNENYIEKSILKAPSGDFELILILYL